MRATRHSQAKRLSAAARKAEERRPPRAAFTFLRRCDRICDCPRACLSSCREWETWEVVRRRYLRATATPFSRCLIRKAASTQKTVSTQKRSKHTSGKTGASKDSQTQNKSQTKNFWNFRATCLSPQHSRIR